MAVLQGAQGWRVADPIVRRLPEIKGGRRIKSWLRQGAPKP